MNNSIWHEYDILYAFDQWPIEVLAALRGVENNPTHSPARPQISFGQSWALEQDHSFCLLLFHQLCKSRNLFSVKHAFINLVNKYWKLSPSAQTYQGFLILRRPARTQWIRRIIYKYKLGSFINQSLNFLNRRLPFIFWLKIVNPWLESHALCNGER